MEKLVKSITRLAIVILGTVFLTFPVLWALDGATGFFTYMHLKNQEKLVEMRNNPDLSEKLIVKLKKESESFFMWKRKIAAIELGKLGAKAKPALPTLQKLAEDKDFEVRESAEKAIQKINADISTEQDAS